MRQEEVQQEEPLEIEERYIGTKAPGLAQYIYVIVVGLLWAIVVALLAQFLFTVMTQAPRFCDTGVASPDCLACPPHAVCADGKLYCDPGYIQSGLVCIEDEEVNKLANRIAGKNSIIVYCESYLLVDSAYYILREVKGKYDCNELPREYLFVDELEVLLYIILQCANSFSDCIKRKWCLFSI